MTNPTNRTKMIALALTLAAVPAWAQTLPATGPAVSPEPQQDPHARSVRHGLKLDPVAPLQGTEPPPATGTTAATVGPLRNGPPQTVGPDRIAGPTWTMGPLKVAGPAQLDGPLASSVPVTK
jgi:hypothetical protein